MSYILITLVIMQTVLCVVIIRMYESQKNQTQETLDLCTRIVDEKEKILKVLLYAKLHDEIPKITLDKIEKELDMPSESI